MSNPSILSLIPQRDPFLFVDEILEMNDLSIKTSYKVKGSETFFQGHFPGLPIMPGVLLQEATFQTGAALMGSKSPDGMIGVVTKVENARFKDLIKPGDTLIISVSLLETLANAYYFKGEISKEGKKVLQIQFSCALIEKPKVE